MGGVSSPNTWGSTLIPQAEGAQGKDNKPGPRAGPPARPSKAPLPMEQAGTMASHFAVTGREVTDR